MEMTAVNRALSLEAKGEATKGTNAKQGSEEVNASAFAMLFQGIVLTNSTEPSVVNNSQLKAETSGLEQLVNELAGILESTEQPEVDIMQWFTALGSEEQKAVKMLFNQLLGTEPHKLDLNQFPKAELKIIEGNLDILKPVLDKLNAFTLHASQTDKNQFGGEKELANLNQEANQGDHSRNSKNTETMMQFRANMEVSNRESQTNNTNSHLETKVDVKTLDFSKMQFQHHFTSQVDTAKAEVNLEAQKPMNLHANNENFTAELGKVLIRNLKLPNGITETKIQLYPQELGEVLVKLTAHNGEINAQILAKTALGKELLEGQIHQLKQSLMQQGYQVEKIEVQQVSSNHSTLAQAMKNGFNFSGQQHSSGNRQYQQDVNKYNLNFTEDGEEFTEHLIETSGIDYTV